MNTQLVIVICYTAATLIFGVALSGRSRSSDSFIGHKMGLWAVVFASVGEWLGGTATTGVSEYGFLYGLSGAWYTIANGIGVMFLALFFSKRYRKYGQATVSGIIGKVFGKNAGTISSVILIIVMLAVGLSQMIAVGKLGQSLLGVNFNLAVIVFAAIILIYTLSGGMEAVSRTNLVHVFLMYGGVILAIVLSVSKLGGVQALKSGIETVESAQEGANYLNMFSIGFPKVSSWLLASLLGACTAQAGIQPVLASKDEHTAKKSCIITALIVAPFGLFTALIGIISKVMSVQGTLLDTAGAVVTDAKLAFSTLLMNLNPVAGGIVAASVMAAILSTASPIILAAGTLYAKDIYQNVMRPQATDKQVLLTGRLATAVSCVICCLGAILLVNSSQVLDIVYSAYSLRGAIFIIILFGFFWKKASPKAACVSMILTTVVAVAWAVVEIATGSYPVASWFTETYAAVITAALSMLVFSMLFRNKDGQISPRAAG